MQSTADVRAAYNVWSRQYESNENATRDLNAAVLRRQSFELDGKTVLELGCGTGINTAWLAEQARSVVAVDLAETMLDGLPRRLGAHDVRPIQADVTAPWPLARAFDLIIATLILEHVEDLDHVFAEADRVLRPGGFVYLAELHPYKQLLGSQARFLDAESGAEIRVPAFRHSISEYVNAALDSGFALSRMDEHQTGDDRIPRLLTLLFERA